MRTRANQDDGIGPLTIVLLLVAALLFGRLLAHGIDLQLTIGDQQRAEHQQMLAGE